MQSIVPQPLVLWLQPLEVGTSETKNHPLCLTGGHGLISVLVSFSQHLSSPKNIKPQNKEKARYYPDFFDSFLFDYLTRTISSP